MGFPGGSEDKASACKAEDPGSIPGLGRSLEKEMVTHSSIPAWRIPWTKEPGGLQSTGSQRVGHDWVTSHTHTSHSMGFPGGSDSKEFACNAEHLGLIPGLGRTPGGWHGNPLQYSCLENPHRQRSLAGYSPWGLKESDMTERLSTAQLSSAQHNYTGMM